MDVNVTIKIEVGESVKNLFAEVFKLVGARPAAVVKEKEAAIEQPEKPVSRRLQGNPCFAETSEQPEDVVKEEAAEEQPEEAVKEEPKAPAKRTRSTSKKVETPAVEPEPENIPEIPEDEAELTGDETPAGDPVDENGDPLTPQKIQVIAMRKGLPAFKAALNEVTGGTVKTLQALHGADMQGVYNYLLKLEDAKGR